MSGADGAAGSARPLARRFGSLIQVGGLIRKEVVEILRQPRVLLVLVAGPFAVLLLFAAGFDRRETVLVTTFVGPEGSVYEDSLAEFGEELDDYIRVHEYTPDLVAARRQLVDREIDLIVVFPHDPAATVLAGERASIDVIHDKLDPIQQTAVEVSTEVAIQELNARILEAAVARAQTELGEHDETATEVATLIDELGQAAAADDDERVAEKLAELDAATGALASIADVSNDVAAALDSGGDADVDALSTSTDRLRQDLLALASAPENVTEQDADRLSLHLDTVREVSERATSLDPRVVVRPFTSATAALERNTVTEVSFFATGAIALLLQHMVFTFAAISLVTDRGLGLFELFRIGPIGAGRVLIGKYVAYTLIGGAVSAALLAAVHVGLDVPLRGRIAWLFIGVALVLIASIGFGSVVSLLSQTTTQAVQYSLLVLLAALFFSGLFLDLGTLVYPVKAVVWVLPATYGTSIFREVMLRGNDPLTTDVVGLVATSLAYLLLAWYLLSRRLRTG